MSDNSKHKEELKVLQKAKQLSEEIFEITELSPKKFRFTLVQRMQDISLEIITNVYLANDVRIRTRFVEDLEKSIASVRNHISEEKDSEQNTDTSIFLERKLYELKLRRASELSERARKRLDYSYEAFSKIKLLGYLVELALKTGCITEKQNRRLTSTLFDLRNLMVAFINSDRRRFGE